MDTNERTNRPDIAAAARGGDKSQGMDDEPQSGDANPALALFWRDVYTEILAMEEAVLARVHELKNLQTPVVRREVELSNVPVIQAQVDRFRARLAYWQLRVETPD